MVNITQDHNGWYGTETELTSSGLSTVFDNKSTNHTALFGNGVRNVHLSASLGDLNFPSQYLVELFLQDNFKNQGHVFHVPPHQRLNYFLITLTILSPGPRLKAPSMISYPTLVGSLTEL
jgi:hypothetical protein